MFSFPSVEYCLRLADLHRLLYHTSVEVSKQLQFDCGGLVVAAAFSSLLYCARELAQCVNREDRGLACANRESGSRQC